MHSVEKNISKRKKHIQSDRLEFLNQLVFEFKTSVSKDAKEQVLANLVNFAYDPVNYNYFRQLKILDLFLDNLCSKEETFIKFSISGLCNACLDPINKKYICENGLPNIIKLLEHGNKEILLSVITTLIFLTPGLKSDISNPEVIKSMVKWSKDSKDNRIRNLSKIYLEDCCTKEEIEKILLS